MTAIKSQSSGTFQGTLPLALPCSSHHTQLPGILCESYCVLVLGREHWARDGRNTWTLCQGACVSLRPGSREIPAGAPPLLDLALL